MDCEAQTCEGPFIETFQELRSVREASSELTETEEDMKERALLLNNACDHMNGHFQLTASQRSEQTVADEALVSGGEEFRQASMCSRSCRRDSEG